MKRRTFFNRIFSAIESRTWPFRISWLKTLYFNFRSMPVAQAIHLPVYIYTHTQFQTLSGKVEIKGALRRGMIKIGKREDRGQGITIIRNHGVIRLGDGVSIMQGCDIYVAQAGVLEIGNSARVRENVFIYVSSLVSIGAFTGIAYQTTISDDDFHFVLDSNTGEVSDTKSPIIIGSRNWIGSRTVIKKGTITPDNIIVASSYTLLDRDYRESVPEYSAIGGIPARVLRKNLRRVFDLKSEKTLAEHFDQNNVSFFLDEQQGDVDKFCLGALSKS